MLIPFGVFSAAGAGGGAAAGAYELIETSLISTNTSTVTFSSIAQTYKHLQVRFTARSTSSEARVLMRLNGATGSSYIAHYLRGQGSSVSSGDSGTTTSINTYIWTPGDGVDASNIYDAGIVDVLDYASSSKNKTTRSFGGYHSSFKQIGLNSGLYMNTTAISQLDFFLESSASFVAGSRFSLYGIKG